MVQNDDNRLMEFRQLKNEIRGSGQHLVVGIDIAKDRHNAFFGTVSGKVVQFLGVIIWDCIFCASCIHYNVRRIPS